MWAPGMHMPLYIYMQAKHSYTLINSKNHNLQSFKGRRHISKYFKTGFFLFLYNIITLDLDVLISKYSKLTYLNYQYKFKHETLKD